MEAPLEHDAVSSFCMLELFEHNDGVDYTFLCNGVRFCVSMKEEDLGNGDLREEFNSFKADFDDGDNMYHFEKWVLAALNDFISQVAPPQRRDIRTPTTLLGYFSPPTFAFTLVNKEGCLGAIQEDYDPETHGDTSPRTRIADSLHDGGNDEHAEHGCSNHGCAPDEGGSMLRSALPSIPFFLASELERVDDHLHDEELSDIPTKVRRVGTKDLFFFKAGFMSHGHEREMEILSQISRSDQFDPPFRTSNLAGLVMWDSDDEDDTFLMGLLLEYIDGQTLDRKLEEAPLATRTKWMDQVDATVERLHDAGIVWGDVKAQNVMINSTGHAVVIDFGGGDMPEYIGRAFTKHVKVT